MITLGAVFASGKAWGAIDWSWGWVLAPFWGLAISYAFTAIRTRSRKGRGTVVDP